MKLKPIIASLMLLGLAAPAFADDSATQAQLDQMKAQINKMQAVINQNGSAAYQLAQPADWMSRITISGLLNVDGTYGNRSPVTYTGGKLSNLTINNANLLMDAAVNDWTNIHVNLMDRTAGSTTNNSLTPTYADNTLHADEAYVTIGNFAQSPVYLRAGREYVPFGVYDLYPMVVNPTQALAQTSDTAAQVGFVSPVGVYGAAYGFRGTKHNDTTSSTPSVQSYGFNLGYANCADAFGVKLDAGYIANMADVDYIAQGLSSYRSKVPGLSLHAGFNVQQFDIKGDYVQALKSFDAADIANVNNDGGAKPKAWGIEAGYSFPVVNNHTSRLGVGYQHTSNADNIGPSVTVNGSSVAAGLPHDRWYGLYNVNVSKWTDVGFEVYRDRDYSVTTNGTARHATVGVVRLGVKFA